MQRACVLAAALAQTSAVQLSSRDSAAEGALIHFFALFCILDLSLLACLRLHFAACCAHVPSRHVMSHDVDFHFSLSWSSLARCSRKVVGALTRRFFSQLSAPLLLEDHACQPLSCHLNCICDSLLCRSSRASTGAQSSRDPSWRCVCCLLCPRLVLLP